MTDVRHRFLLVKPHFTPALSIINIEKHDLNKKRQKLKVQDGLISIPRARVKELLAFEDFSDYSVQKNPAVVQKNLRIHEAEHEAKKSNKIPHSG